MGNNKTMKLINKTTVLVFLLLASCGTIKTKVRQLQVAQHHKFKEKIIDNFLKKNGNAFYIESAYDPYSVVWSYTQGSIVIYELKRKSIVKKTEFPEHKKFRLDKGPEKFRKILDGVSLGYVIYYENKKYANCCIDIESYLKNKKNIKPGFLKDIIDDIKKYNIWNDLLTSRKNSGKNISK